jgi:hypothetical protein
VGRFRSFSFVLALCGSFAFADTIQYIQPYRPSPFVGAPNALSSQCRLGGLDATHTTWIGLCPYHGGPRYVVWATVTWNLSGVPISATRCYPSGFQGTPACPTLMDGPVMSFLINGIDMQFHVQGTDADGVTGVQGNAPGLVHP